MRMRSCASLLALALLCISGAGQSTYAVEAKQSNGAKARLTVRAPDGREWRVRVALDRTVARDSAPKSVKVVGSMTGALAVVDTYSSKAGGMHLCQAGEESFLRVIRTARSRATETFHEKLESCRDNIELASPGLQWTPKTRTLEVNWLSAPGRAGQPGKQVLEVRKDAAVKVVASGQ
jgi:hypothetical protein